MARCQVQTQKILLELYSCDSSQLPGDCVGALRWKPALRARVGNRQRIDAADRSQPRRLTTHRNDHMQFEAIADYQDLCGEGPLWDSTRNLLFWTDLSGRRFYCYD